MLFNFWKNRQEPPLAAVPQAIRPPALFLDIDGVLHPHQRGTLVHLPLLEEFLRRHSTVQVVVTSTWRMQHSLEDLREFFSEDLRQRVEGVTPFINRTPFSRFQEIQAYLEEQGARQWCALDDDAYLFPPNCPNLVGTQANTGVIPDDLLRVERMLSILA